MRREVDIVLIITSALQGPVLIIPQHPCVFPFCLPFISSPERREPAEWGSAQHLTQQSLQGAHAQ